MPSERAIREVEFAGDHYQRGVQRGRRLKETLMLPEPTDLPPGFVAGCRTAVEQFYPPAVDEFEGILDGGGFDRAAMTAYYFARLESRLGGCTMFGVEEGLRGEGAGPIVGRNYDWAVEDLRWCELHRYGPRGGMNRIAYTHHWAGNPDVMNEAGLHVAIASLPPEPITAPGVQWSILVEMLSETCETVEQAAQACTEVRHLRPMNYLLADAAGGLAVVTAGCDQVRVTPPRDGIVAAANTGLPGEVLAEFLRGEYDIRTAALEGDREQSAARSRRRVARARELLGRARPDISPKDVRTVLKDHETPICTGDHARPDGGVWATIWSGICAPAERDFRIAPGLPCRHPYQQFTL